MTNLLFAIVVTLVTNVTETDNAKYEQIPQPCPESRIGCGVMHGYLNGRKVADATERTITTDIVAQTNAVHGAHSVTIGSAEISRSVKVLRATTAWEVVRDEPVNKVMFFTNYSPVLLITNWPVTAFR